MSETSPEGWPRAVRVTLSAELGGRRVSSSHCEQAKVAAQAAFTAALESRGYSLTNKHAQGEYVYVGWHEES